MSTADDRADRFLPGHCSRCFLRAAAAEAGEYALLMMLQQTGLERGWPLTKNWLSPRRACAPLSWRGCKPPCVSIMGVAHAACSTVLEKPPGIRCWRTTCWATKPCAHCGRGLPRSARVRQTLEGLARQMRGSNGDGAADLLDVDLYLIDRTSDSTLGQMARGADLLGDNGDDRGGAAAGPGQRRGCGRSELPGVGRGSL